MKPDHSGDCVTFRVQRYSDHAWRDYVTSGCLALDSTSTAAYRFHGAPSYVSHSWRMRAEWAGNAENAARNSGWEYVRFTR